ncbi:MAG: helix-turn-helix domain-containing protein [Bacteroidia bacterium]
MKIGENIRKIREIKGYSQEYMAEKLNISQRQYSRIEKEQSKLDFAKFEQISTILEVTPAQLFGFDEKQIFNQYNNEQANGVYHNHFPDELKNQYEKRISQLESENLFLRSLCEKSNQ